MSLVKPKNWPIVSSVKPPNWPIVAQAFGSISKISNRLRTVLGECVVRSWRAKVFSLRNTLSFGLFLRVDACRKAPETELFCRTFCRRPRLLQNSAECRCGPPGVLDVSRNCSRSQTFFFKFCVTLLCRFRPYNFAPQPPTQETKHQPK